MSTIEHVSVAVFRTVTKSTVDSGGHRHPGPPREVELALLAIVDSEGATGRCLVVPDQVREAVIDGYVRPVLLGHDGLDRERLWQRLAGRQRGALGAFTDVALGAVDQALWDLAGRRLGVPVWRLIGGARERVPAYASTMCGEEVPGGLSTPADYAAFAKELAARGYKGIKLHTWMPPVSFAPDPRMDAAACTAVREAVGADVALMLDAHHWYGRTDALRLGRVLDELDFAWYEEPMQEASVTSYRWLADQLRTPVIGPESSWGKHMTRAEWIAAGACDILRVGVAGSGGITPAVKTMHLAEAFGMDCEIHGGGSGALAVLCATSCGRWYERGLVHPHADYEEPPPHLRSIIDPMDGNGFVGAPTNPGLGDDLDVDYITDNVIAQW